jgi:hypothetical protein
LHHSVFAAHAVLQSPQWSWKFCGSKQTPLHAIMLCGHAMPHEPASHVADPRVQPMPPSYATSASGLFAPGARPASVVTLHAFAHEPQCSVSVCVFAQMTPPSPIVHFVVGASHCDLHVPLEHTSVDAHACVHEPQWS